MWKEFILLIFVVILLRYVITNLKVWINSIKNKENKIKHVLESELKEYEKYMLTSKKILEKESITPKGNNLMAKVGSDMGIMMETIKDNSDPALASMLIEGITMGVVDMESKVKDYKAVCDKNILEIAKDFLKFQENEIEKLKTFM